MVCLLHWPLARAGEPAGTVPPAAGITTENLAVVINKFDRNSVALGEYYQKQRGIPDSNMIYVRIWSNGPEQPVESFGWLRKAVLKKTAPHIQAYALAWTFPWKVGCQSITTAMTFGYDPEMCQPVKCGRNKPNPYAGSASRRPFDDFGIRPSMLMAAFDLDRAKALVDRGVAADGSADGDEAAYLLAYPREIRSFRSARYPAIVSQFGDRLSIHTLETYYIRDRHDVMFYFTGATNVADIETNTFLPGALADHVTSYGGRLRTREENAHEQMSIMRWLEAGATGSYGTIDEPCATASKFPDPEIVMREYISGSSLIEAYWKSVREPMQGIFIGEPLARPYGGRAGKSGEPN